MTAVKVLNITNKSITSIPHKVVSSGGIPINDIIAIIVAIIGIIVIILLLKKFQFKIVKQRDVFKIVENTLNMDMLFNAVNKKTYLNFSNQLRFKVLAHSVDKTDKNTIEIFKIKIPLKLKTLYAFVFLDAQYVKKVGKDYIVMIENIGFKSLGNLIIENDILIDTNNYIKNMYIFREDYKTILNEYENANLSRAVVSDIETAKKIKTDTEHLQNLVELLNNKNFKQINSMINS